VYAGTVYEYIVYEGTVYECILYECIVCMSAQCMSAVYAYLTNCAVPVEPHSVPMVRRAHGVAHVRDILFTWKS
jgi:hypothetical protein